MSKIVSEKSDRRDSGRFEWILELAIFATILPAVVYGMLSLNNLPVVASSPRMPPDGAS